MCGGLVKLPVVFNPQRVSRCETADAMLDGKRHRDRGAVPVGEGLAVPCHRPIGAHSGPSRGMLICGNRHQIFPGCIELSSIFGRTGSFVRLIQLSYRMDFPAQQRHQGGEVTNETLSIVDMLEKGFSRIMQK